MTQNMGQYLQALKDNGTPYQLYFHRGGHGGAPPDSLINRWFTRYLWLQPNGVENEPKAWVVRETNACPSAFRDRRRRPVEHHDAHRRQHEPAHLRHAGRRPGDELDGTVSNTTATVLAVPDSTHVVFSAAVATAAGSKVANGRRSATTS